MTMQKLKIYFRSLPYIGNKESTYQAMKHYVMKQRVHNTQLGTFGFFRWHSKWNSVDKMLGMIDHMHPDEKILLR